MQNSSHAILNRYYPAYECPPHNEVVLGKCVSKDGRFYELAVFQQEGKWYPEAVATKMVAWRFFRFDELDGV